MRVEAGCFDFRGKLLPLGVVDLLRAKPASVDNVTVLTRQLVFEILLKVFSDHESAVFEILLLLRNAWITSSNFDFQVS